MARQTVTVTNPTGLHARPAAEFTKVASGLECGVHLEKDGTSINAKSILGVLTLGVNQGDEIDIVCEGPGADAGVAELVALVESLQD